MPRKVELPDESEVEATFHEMEDQSMGWCTICKDWTRFQTEPDAEGYDCPDCERNTVIGALNWLMAIL